MSKVLVWLIAGIVAVAVVLAATLAYLPTAAAARYDRKIDVVPVDIPIPWPDESGDEGVAMQNAIERGRRYVESRAACSECHGENLAGGIVVDQFPMGRWVAPNITRGGQTADYTPADWVRIIRHGIRKDGRPANMPSRDYTNLSDQEVSDIAAYIGSVPAVSEAMPPTVIGPIMALMILSGEIAIDADHIDHEAVRPRLPPVIGPTLELGSHLAATCVGCHGMSLTGGPVPGGDPAWPDASNLTFHDSGLAGYTLEEFRTVLRTGARPDGSRLHEAMPIAYTGRLVDDEIEALYLYLKSMTPVPKGGAAVH